MSDHSSEVEEVGSAETPARHLHAVDEKRAPDSSEDGDAKARRPLLWGLAAALLITAIFLILQIQKSGELSAQVQSLGLELSATNDSLSTAEATITRFELRMDEVRGSVGAILSRVGALQELVDRDPAADPPGVPISPSTPLSD